ncbi:MAG: UDP-N-acetylmuramoyl-L-alanine--D-glutamate ligase [Lachnospiraceae bacterium]|nr:UDP-N-acetylmuramoyl-L-alanine--D-glutamate ligase [Lachnospiraceae bacterium]
MKTDHLFNDKKILIWGYGREGMSTEKWLASHVSPKAVDISSATPEEMLAGAGEGYDVIIKSPGIVWPPKAEFSSKEDLEKIGEISEKITSQTEIFISTYKDKTIGVTGTKGKSTTVSMLAHVLSETSGKKVILAGNIGLPCLDYYDDAEGDSIVVLELSCHQLKGAKTAPHISVFLDLYEEHLDYYGSMDAYFEAKSHIVSRQICGDRAYIGENVPEIKSDSEQIRVVPSHEDLEGIELGLYGEHNRINAYFVKKICMDNFGISEEDVLKSLNSFEALPHRMKKIGTYEGIDFYDDSISTIPEAAISAATSIPGAQVILVGGMDRGISYSVLEDFMKEHAEFKFICMYATGKRITDELGEGISNVYYAEDLEGAVKKAFEITDKDRGCVLSPAAASYGYFKNFEERGDVFAQLVVKHGSDKSF